MTEMSVRVMDRARSLCGTRFRPQGRDPVHGLDCVGLAACAAGLSAGEIPADYNFRSRITEKIQRLPIWEGLNRIEPNAAAPGDIVLVQVDTHQHHFVVLTDLGYVHADARLRRVTETPGDLPWPIVFVWRVKEF